MFPVLRNRQGSSQAVLTGGVERRLPPCPGKQPQGAGAWRPDWLQLRACGHAPQARLPLRLAPLQIPR